MKIILCSNNIDHISYWQNALGDLQSSCMEYEDLKSVQGCILILYEGVCNCLEMQTICKNNRVLLLTELLHSNKFQFYFHQGVLGYGNIYMQEIFLLSALQTLQNNDVWIAPKLNRELMQKVKNHHSAPSTNLLEKHLTAKELLIAELLCEGYTNLQIAQKRAITLNTLKSHIKNIYAKLNVKSRFELLKFYQEQTHPQG